MGLRFRKSINLGGGFKINLSKSGIGYSFGAKGYRITKKANGGTRHTASIPGTGISYVHETGSAFKRHPNKNNGNGNSSQSPEETNVYDTKEISNASVKEIHSAGMEDIIDCANKSLKLNKYSTIGLIVSALLGFAYPFFFLITVGCFIWKIYIKKNGIVDLDYTIDDEQRAEIDARMSPLKKIASSNKIWRITQSSSVIDRKYSSGASSTIKRISCLSSRTLPFPFNSNEEAICFKSGKETLIFLPDKFFIIQSGTVGALSYSDLTSTVSGTRFVESETVPSDAKIVDRTWKYVNKSGGPDKRFSDNRQLPVCLYGELTLRSKNDCVNTVLMFSNSDIE
jgi:hypothetical protein